MKLRVFKTWMQCGVGCPEYIIDLQHRNFVIFLCALQDPQMLNLLLLSHTLSCSIKKQTNHIHCFCLYFKYHECCGAGWPSGIMLACQSARPGLDFVLLGHFDLCWTAIQLVHESPTSLLASSLVQGGVHGSRMPDLD